ncbi:hypothetical protein [Desulfitibacter alkalitolerans]|uniref:hypothetical protein n=1 Tax=Desulfitibacter alkalitolerans TaxID=264641 RepID=UPI00048137C4|nr:hypothetical protein [Desulfitibacter alkalitolerans]
MIVVTIPNWRKKLIILACIILLAAAFSIGLNYYKSINTTIEFEEMFDNPIGSEVQALEGEEEAAAEGAQGEAAQAQPGNEVEVVKHDQTNEACEDEKQEKESPEDKDLEQEFKEKEVKKGFWQKILEKFRKE